MVPDIAKKGHSFKGAMAYYLHDKRQDDGPNPSSAERVAWTETRNLATHDPAIATRIMIATAKDADRLKEAAGIKNTGRKSNAHVYAYSLAWHPDEAGKLDRAEMVRAADSSLRALGADHLQAVIICHRDQKHPHVHVVLNRVDPETGRMHGFSNDRLVLSDWANKYERERGQIFTPLREVKRELRQEFSDQAARRDHVQAQKPARRAGTPSPATMLKELSDAQKVGHRQQWADLATKNKTERERIYTAFDGRIRQTLADHKDAERPLWSEHFRTVRAETRQFERRERGLVGVVVNAFLAHTKQQAQGAAPGRGALAGIFINTLQADARRAAFDEWHETSRKALTARLRAVTDVQIAAVKRERVEVLRQQRDAFQKARAVLIEKQNGERAKTREAWRHVYERRAKDPRFAAAQERRQKEQDVRSSATTSREIRAAFSRSGTPTLAEKKAQARTAGRGRFRTQGRELP